MDFFIELVENYGMIAIFFLIMIEYACFPIPSEFVLPFAGAVASINNISLFLVIIIATLAGYIGSLICYYIGYFGGYPLLLKIGKRFPKANKGIIYSKDFFNKYANLSVGLARIIPLARTYISLIAGAFKQKILSYSVFSLFGIIVWNSVLVSVGYLLSDNWQIIANYYESYKLIVLFLIILIAFAFALSKTIKYYKNKK